MDMELIFTVYKKSENDFILINNKKILCLYGAGYYLININHIIKDKFIDNNKIIIKKDILFSKVFPKATENEKRNLLISIDKKEYVYDEFRKNDITPILK